RRPCLRALSRERLRPVTVVGPRDFRPFSRLFAARCSAVKVIATSRVLCWGWGWDMALSFITIVSSGRAVVTIRHGVGTAGRSAPGVVARADRFFTLGGKVSGCHGLSATRAGRPGPEGTALAPSPLTPLPRGERGTGLSVPCGGEGARPAPRPPIRG